MNELNHKTSTIIIIFGASGDLTHRKLIPALYNSFKKNRIPCGIKVIGFARRPYNNQSFRSRLENAKDLNIN